MEQPQEFDDPNTTISNILDRLRRFGVTIDFAPSKLKQGYGEQALFVLDRLSDEALRATQFTWSQPEAPEEEAKEDEEMEDDAEVLLDRVEEDMAGETSDEEEEDILHIDDFKSYHQNKVDSPFSFPKESISLLRDYCPGERGQRGRGGGEVPPRGDPGEHHGPRAVAAGGGAGGAQPQDHRQERGQGLEGAPRADASVQVQGEPVNTNYLRTFYLSMNENS